MRGFVISLGLHLAVLFALFFQWPAASAPASARHSVVHVFVPVPREEDGSSEPKKSKYSDLKTPFNPVGGKSSRPKLDLAVLELRIEDDTAKNLIVVLKRYRGKIVALDPATLAVRSAFWASTGEPARKVSLAGGLPVILHQPEWWPETAALKDKAPGDSLICALFPPDFIEAMGNAIQEQAAKIGVAEIHRVTFSFTSTRGLGLVIHEIG